jgi:CubicO group peptidase (beta-lactamase class C family)
MPLRYPLRFPWRAAAFAALACMLATLLLVLGRAGWIGVGFFAKQLCSEVFVAGRDAPDVVAHDLQVFQPAALFDNVSWRVEPAAGRVVAAWLGLIRREAQFVAPHGCVLRSAGGVLSPGPDRRPLAASFPPPLLRAQGEHTGRHALRARLARVVERAFQEPQPELPRRTRAVLVLQDGRVLAERYAAGFDAGTRFCGWSMTKSVINALMGALAQQGRLRVNDRVPVAAWAGPGDDRAALTYDHLLHMSSGLAFDESYDDPFSDVTTMLYGTGDVAAYAADKPLVAAPNTLWSYGSGTTNVLTRALRQLRLPGVPYEEMPRRLLFDRLGMDSALIEMDETGTFVGSSYMWATARDWARFGELFTANGVWNGERVLPEGWVTYSATPAPADAKARYGAHFWLYNAEEREKARRLSAAAIPPDAFFAGGFGGQRITIIPSRGLVIVRLGYTLDAEAWNNAGFVAQVLEALAPVQS